MASMEPLLLDLNDMSWLEGRKHAAQVKTGLRPEAGPTKLKLFYRVWSDTPWTYVVPCGSLVGGVGWKFEGLLRGETVLREFRDSKKEAA